MATSTPGPNPVTGAFVAAISTLASGSTGTKFSFVDAYFDDAAFTVTVDTSGPRPRIKIALDPAATPTFTNIVARSLVLGVGYPGQTNLDVTGAALFRGPVTFAAAPSGVLMPPVDQPAIAAGVGSANKIIFKAPASASVKILKVVFTSAQPLTADDAVFDTMQLHDFSAAGADGGYMADAAFATTVTDVGHTGNWTVGVDVFTWTPAGGYTLAAGHRLIAMWDCSNGGGTEILSGNVWTIQT